MYTYIIYIMTRYVRRKERKKTPAHRGSNAKVFHFGSSGRRRVGGETARPEMCRVVVVAGFFFGKIHPRRRTPRVLEIIDQEFSEARYAL